MAPRGLASAKTVNEICDNLNPLMNIQIVRGSSDRVFYTRDRIILQVLTNGIKFLNRLRRHRSRKLRDSKRVIRVLPGQPRR